MAITRQKALGKRIDGGYVHRPHPMRRWRRAAVVGVGVVALAWFAVSGLRVDGRRLRLEGTLHNPGPVTRAHAFIENDCAQCHTGDNHRGFARGVSDVACLNCHDGAIHAATQKTAGDPQQLKGDALTFAIKDETHPFGHRSAKCSSCHVEHRDEAALAAASEQHCVQCHGQLGESMDSGKPSPVPTKPVVTAFDKDHRGFGRYIPTQGGQWWDRTRLKFDHAKHAGENVFGKHPGGMGALCASCHQPWEPPTTMPGIREDWPPFVPQPSATGIPYRTGDGRHMRPISYELHCAECHPLNVLEPEGGGLTIQTFPHVDMQTIRSIITSELYALAPAPPVPAAQPKEEREGEGDAADPPEPSERAIWITENIDARLGDLDKIKAHLDPEYVAPTTRETARDDLPLLVDFYAAALASSKCVDCHEFEGALPVPELKDRAPLRTKPTGIPSSPRRWFRAHEFDHDAHRNMHCVDCHAQALVSKDTSDVLLPDIMPNANATVGCVQCHKSDDSIGRSAPANCVTCHNFHDRTQEGPAKNSLISSSPASQPATQPGVASAE